MIIPINDEEITVTKTEYENYLRFARKHRGRISQNGTCPACGAPAGQQEYGTRTDITRRIQSVGCTCLACGQQFVIIEGKKGTYRPRAEQDTLFDLNRIDQGRKTEWQMEVAR